MIQRRPLASALASFALLLVLASPILALRLGSADAGTDAKSTTTRQAYDLLAKGFGAGFNGPMQIVAKLPSAGDTGAAAALRSGFVGLPDVAAVSPATYSPNGEVAVINVFPRTSPQAAATTTLLNRLRDNVIPPLEHSDSGQRLRRRDHCALRRLQQPAVEQAAALHRRGGADLGAAAAGGLPLGVRRRQGDRDEPAQRGRRVRRRCRGLPVGLAGGADRDLHDGADSRVPAGDGVRDRLRPVDGLRGLPDVAHARGVGAHRRRRLRDAPRARCDRARDHRSRGDHGLRVRARSSSATA